MKYEDLSLKEKELLYKHLMSNGIKIKSIEDLKDKYNSVYKNKFKNGGLFPKSQQKYIRKYSEKIKDNDVNVIEDKYDLVLGNGILPIKFIKDNDVSFWKNELQEANLNNEEDIVRFINNYGLDRYFSDETKQLYQDLYGNVRYDPFIQQKINKLDDNEKIALISAIKSGNIRNTYDLITNVLNKNDIPIYFDNEFLERNNSKINERLNYLLLSKEERDKKAIETFNSLSEKDKMRYIHSGAAFYTEDGRYIRPGDAMVNGEDIYDRYNRYLESYKKKLNDIHLEGLDVERLPYYFDKKSQYYDTKNGEEKRKLYPYLDKNIQAEPLNVNINGEERRINVSPFKLVNKFNDEEINGNYLYNNESVERLDNIIDFANRIKGINPNYEDRFELPLSPNEVYNTINKYVDETVSGIKYSFDYFNSSGFKQRNDALMQKYKPYSNEYNKLIGNKGIIDDAFLNDKDIRFSVGYDNADNSLNFGISPSTLNFDFRNTGAHEGAHLNRIYNQVLQNPTKEDNELSPYYSKVKNATINYRHIPDIVKTLLTPNVKVDYHDKEINENYSDLIGTRSNLQNEGIFNSMLPDQSFTKEMYDRYRNTDAGKKDRFMNTHSEQQVIDALNIIAHNNKKNNDFSLISPEYFVS